MLLLPTVALAQTADNCSALEQQCKEIEAFSKAQKENNKDILETCKERIRICRDNIKEITKDGTMPDYASYVDEQNKLIKEVNALTKEEEKAEDSEEDE